MPFWFQGGNIHYSSSFNKYFCAPKHKRHTKFIVAQYLQLYHDDMTLIQSLSSYTKHHKYKANIYAYDITGSGGRIILIGRI